MIASLHKKKIRLSNKKVITKTIKKIIKCKWIYITILITPASISSSTPEIPKPIIEVVFKKADRKREYEPEKSFITDFYNIPGNIDYGLPAIGEDLIDENGNN